MFTEQLTCVLPVCLSTWNNSTHTRGTSMQTDSGDIN